MEAHYLTKERFQELTTELADLRTNKRKDIARTLEYARSLGDLSENAEYHQAREDQAVIEDRIQTVENILKNAKIIEGHHSTVVEVGSTIVVKKNDEKDSHTFTIVGADESDFKSGKISNTSPLGSAFLGKKKEDEVKVKTPKGTTKYKIVSIK
ncbi:MAG TPA: transcription elongation factor GreA [Candidatus Paceibacterota bacterium]|nr:transcription elongation factor GreA [Candidatus Paceibacterota bacterium]